MWENLSWMEIVFLFGIGYFADGVLNALNRIEQNTRKKDSYSVEDWMRDHPKGTRRIEPDTDLDFFSDRWNEQNK